MVRYSFPVGLSHSLLHAGLSRRSHTYSLCFFLAIVDIRNGRKCGPPATHSTSFGSQSINESARLFTMTQRLPNL